MFDSRLDWNDLDQFIMDHIKPMQYKDQIPIKESLHRVVAREYKTTMAMPPYSRSLVDGYATRGRPPWKIIGSIKVTELFPDELEEGQAVYLPTGGIVPEGTEYVVKIEKTETVKNDFIEPKGEYSLNSEIEPEGNDFKKGDVILRAGNPITTQVITKLAASGIGTVEVYRRPKATIIVTGDEILPPGEDVKPGYVFDSTSAMLRGFLEELGVVVVEVILVSETYDAIRTAFSAAISHSDIIITTGGTSMGREDNVYRVIEGVGKLLFHGINVRPGKPMAMGQIENIPVLAFPGFVTSSAIMANILLPKIIATLSRQPLAEEKKISVKIGEECKGFPGWYRLLTGKIVNGEFIPVFSTSSAVSSFADSTGYIVIPPDRLTPLLVGESVNFYPFLG